MQIAVTGSSGMIGSALCTSLRDDGHEVLPIVRSTPAPAGTVRWDPQGGEIDAAGLEGVDAVVHLAGAGIGDHRWTDEYKREIHDSRSRGTDLLARTLAGLDDPPKVLLSASGVHYYGHREDEVLTEDSGPGGGFLAGVVADWEAATEPASTAGIRTVHFRNGVVLSREGGALAKMLLPFRFALGGRLGSGDQWMSWIALDDEIEALVFLLEHDDISGPVNLCSPEPVTNRDFTEALGRALHRPAVLPIPRTGPRLLLGRELADELLFFSIRAQPAKLEAAGFRFLRPQIDAGLRAALDARER
jgi:uncharacterized protein (TIGR01777 family)